MVKEMIELRKMLDERRITYRDESDDYGIQYRIDRTKIDINGGTVSVINGYGTYGGHSAFDTINKGLLEVMDIDGEIYGCLTAEEVIKCFVDSRNGKGDTDA